MKRYFHHTVVAAWAIGLALIGSVTVADDDETRDERTRRQVRIAERVASKHWVGVHAVPVDEALKAQLNLEERLIVRAVMPDSPAADGGIKQHDILLKFGDRDITKLDDLLKAVAANKDKATKVVVLRGGKELSLDIQPAERPENIEVQLPERRFEWKPLEGWLGGPVGGRLRIVGPGVLDELPELPGNLSINITKQNDEPAKITVKRDDDTWEITEDDIDELPEDLREHVRRQIDHHHGRDSGALTLRLNEDGALRYSPRIPIPEGASEAVRERLEQAIRQLEQLQKRMSAEDPFKALQEEMRSLRQEFEKLREQNQPTDPPESDARDV